MNLSECDRSEVLAESYAGLVDEHSLQRLLDTRTAARVRVRVGTDVQQVEAVELALRHHGDRYLDRVFTAHEQESVGLPGPVTAGVVAGLAARFAAKEAVVKVLRPVDVGIPWRDIEIRRRSGRWCSPELGGLAARLADEASLDAWDLSFSHDGGVAVATVVALQRGPVDPRGAGRPEGDPERG